MLATTISNRPSATNPHASPAPRLSFNEAIFDAARQQDWTAVQFLLASHEGTFEGQDPVGNTLSYFLIKDASDGIIETFHDLKQLITENKLPAASLSQANQFGKTPLHLVAKHFNSEIWKFLIQHGANPELGDNDHQSALDILNAHNPAAARWLQQHARMQTARPNDMRYSNNDCPVCLDEIGVKGQVTPCGHKFHIVCMRRWLARNSEANQVCPICKDPVNLKQLQPFIPDNNHEKNPGLPSAPPAYIDYLHERDLPETTHGIEESKTEEPRMTREQAQAELANAAKTGDIDVLRQVLSTRGIDVNAKDRHGKTALHLAVSEGKTEAIKLLLNANADIDISCNLGWTPAYTAAINGHADVLKLLLENGADKNKATNDGFTLAYTAAAYGHADVLKLLLENGSDSNKASNDGFTLAYTAAAYGHADVLKMLLENGADKNKASNYGYTPAFIAAFKGHADVLKVLLENGADLHKASNDGRTPIDVAIEKNHTQVLNLFATNSDFILHLAEHKNTNYIKLLAPHCADLEGLIRSIRRIRILQRQSLTARRNTQWAEMLTVLTSVQSELTRESSSVAR